MKSQAPLSNKNNWSVPTASILWTAAAARRIDRLNLVDGFTTNTFKLSEWMLEINITHAQTCMQEHEKHCSDQAQTFVDFEQQMISAQPRGWF